MVGSLFAGIGGFELGLERTGGFETKWQCEIDPFCQKVLAKHWPNVTRFADIKEMNEVPYVDVICGGFPCQPVSCAGKRKGSEDKRWLWPEFYRIVCEVRPEWVLVENVPGLLSAKDADGIKGRLFAGILRDLAASGYDAEWNIVSATSVGAPHLRRRVFIIGRKMDNALRGGYQVSDRSTQAKQDSDWQEDRLFCAAGSDVAHTQCTERWPEGSRRCEMARQDDRLQGREEDSGGFELSSQDVANTMQPRLEERSRIFSERGTRTTINGCDWWAVEPGMGRVAHGVPARVDRLRSLGNAIVPQCAEFVGRCVLGCY